MTKLDEIAVNVELVLISLIEGVALVTLGTATYFAWQDPEWYRYIVFELAGLFILILFWTQSILHAVSFIRWPMRIEHMFLYFASALIQIVAYSYLTNLTMWFFFWILFSLVTMAMYFVDLWIMRDTEKVLAKKEGGAAFFKEVEARHLYEMKFLVPAALAFNIVIWLLSLVFPKLFQSVWTYMIPGTLQLAFSVYALYDCTKNFRVRSEMIAKLFEDPVPALAPAKKKSTTKSRPPREATDLA